MKNYTLLVFFIVSMLGMSNLLGQIVTPSLISNNPKAMFSNPALYPERGSFLSLPVLGSFNAGASNSFSFNDIMEKRNSAYYLLTAELLSVSANKSHFLTSNYNVDILHAGFDINEHNHLSLSLRNRMSAGGRLPVELLEFALDNPINKTATFDMNFDFNATIWNEIGVAFTHSLNSNWNFGARLKLLTGLANVMSNNSIYSIEKVATGSYFLSSNVDIKTAAWSDGGVDINSWFGNPGIAVDFGAQYKSANKRWSINAGASDLGKIFWNKAVGAHTITQNPNNRLEFTGFGDLEATLNDSDFDIERQFDSVWNAFEDTAGIVTSKNYKYSTTLPATFQVFGTYSIDQNLSHNIGLGFEGRMLSDEIFYYGLTGSYYWLSPKRVWQLLASYTYYSNSANGFGVSAAFNSAGFQVYLGLENVSMFSYLSTKHVGLDLGISWFL